MKRNVTEILITGINVSWQGKMLDLYMDQTCLLRYARKVGDTERVNNFVLGRLNEQQALGCLTFEKVKK